MHVRLKLVLLTAIVGASFFAGTVLATPGSGVTSSLIAVGRFEPFDTFVETGRWRAALRTKGVSDIHVLENRIAPGGTFGWHSHPGPSFVIVKSGTATFYLANDASCSPQVVNAGEGFVDMGGDIHVVKNEGTTELVTVVTSLVPTGATRRIDQPQPSHCTA